MEETKNVAEEDFSELPQTTSIRSEFSFKNPVVRASIQLHAARENEQEPIPCQESEEDVQDGFEQNDDSSISFKEDTTVLNSAGQPLVPETPTDPQVESEED